MGKVGSKLGNANLVSTFALRYNVLPSQLYCQTNQIFLADVDELSQLWLFLFALSVTKFTIKRKKERKEMKMEKKNPKKTKWNKNNGRENETNLWCVYYDQRNRLDNVKEVSLGLGEFSISEASACCGLKLVDKRRQGEQEARSVLWVGLDVRGDRGQWRVSHQLHRGVFVQVQEVLLEGLEVHNT